MKFSEVNQKIAVCWFDGRTPSAQVDDCDSRATWRHKLECLFFVAAFFLVCFYGADRVAEFRAVKIDFSMQFEPLVPFVAYSFVVYASAPVFCLVLLASERRRRALLAWRNAMCTAICLAAIAFISMPSAPFLSNMHRFAPEFERVILLLTGQHNHFPSLHVTLTVASLVLLIPVRERRRRRLFCLWAIGIVASTLSTHQHTLLDVAGGLVLAVLVVYRFGDLR